VITEKGRGFPLKQPDVERFHARNPYDPVTGVLRSPTKPAPTWTKVFGETLTELGAEHPEIVAITAAMPSGTGTDLFQRRFPERFFDVGIAEGHAVTFAAGMATQGIRPVVAIYSTFLQRAFDSIVHDVAIQRLPVILCLDRAGMVGADGQTHMGLYDLAYLSAVPNMTVTQPKDGTELVGLLRCALGHQGGPFAIRYPRDNVAEPVPPVATVPPVPYGTWELLRHGKDCALLSVGVMTEAALEAAELLARDGLDVTVVNCRFVKPLDQTMLQALLVDHRLLVTIEDGTEVNGFGAQVAVAAERLAPDAQVVVLGVPDRTFEHASRQNQLAEAGLTGSAIADRVRARTSEESFSVR
jgi:1-deoxy-D-xylulose-5-phosphate synthase